ncbi:MAG: aspartate aminotransferase family protein [Nevskiales bacterium]
MTHLISNYNRLDVSFSHGEGAWLVDNNGRRYLDALCGIGVTNLGHAHPAVAAAISAQAGKLLHCSNLYQIELQAQLADELCAAAGMQAALFVNSGTEANEAAIKLARKYGYDKGIKEPKIIVMDKAFHGRTLGALAATGNVNAQTGFGPLPAGFIRVAYGDTQAVRNLADSADIVAVHVEPIQGEGGVNIPPAGYLSELRKICDSNGWLLMLDEVQTGIGRTGQWFACQHEQVTADVMCLAKGLGNGMPIGALLVSGAAHGVLTAGSHGSTFGGNPLACAAALAVLATIREQSLLAHASKRGAQLLAGLQSRLESVNGVVEIRGQGMMLAIELNKPCAELVTQALQQGLLINVTASNTVRLLPPITLSESEAMTLLDKLCPLIEDFLS